MVQRTGAPKFQVEPTGHAKQVPVVFENAENTPLEFVNAFVPQVQPSFLVLVCAQVVPPVITGEPAQIRAASERVSAVKAQTIARLALTPETAQELIVVLGQALEHHQQLNRQIAEETSNEPTSE